MYMYTYIKYITLLYIKIILYIYDRKYILLKNK